jgi:NADH dehydrogenase
MTGWEGVARLAAVTPVVPVMGSGHYRSMPVHAGDLMQAVIQAVERDDVLGRVFEIGGPQTVTFNALLEAIADTLHLRRRLVHIPLRLARGLAWTMAVLPNPAITRDELDSLLLDNVCDNTDVVRTFGLTLTPLRESLRLALSESRNGES